MQRHYSLVRAAIFLLLSTACGLETREEQRRKRFLLLFIQQTKREISNRVDVSGSEEEIHSLFNQTDSLKHQISSNVSIIALQSLEQKQQNKD